ncbi:MAG TPA: hypothetical protein PK686_02980 [bacterium]|nr:hypothetical protein [bacterium]HPV65618.1 hypothetical protein [bacterium]
MEIKLKFIGFKNDYAVLKNDENNQEILWPQNYLPTGINEGSYLNFLVSESSQDDLKRKQLAKDILNEILNVE